MTISLPNILKATNLDEEARGILKRLLAVQRNVAARNAERVKYFEGDVEPAQIGIDTIPPTVNLHESCAWPKKAVTSVSERARFEGFVFESGNQDEGLAKVVKDNNLIGSFNRHTPSELIHGCMFGTVGKFNGKTIVRFHTAETSAGVWDAGNDRLGAGFVIADCGVTDFSKQTPVPTQVNLHLPGRVVVLKRIAKSSWVAESLETPLDRPMMEAFAFRGTGTKPFGESRITESVMAITQDVLRTLVYMAVSAAFYAHPKQYLLGLTEEQYDKISKNKWGAMINAMLLGELNEENENSIQYGQLPATSPQPYIDMLRTYAQMFSAATGVPINSLGIVQDNPSSAEAITAAREDICIAVEDLNESNGESLRQIALMAMAVEESCKIDDLTDDQRSVMAHFKDPSMPSIVSQADAAIKIVTADPSFAQTTVFKEMLGFSAADIARINAEGRAAKARESIAQLMRQPAEDDGKVD